MKQTYEPLFSHDAMHRAACVLILLLVLAFALLLSSCSAPMVTQTVTRKGLTGGTETVVTKTPFVDPMEAALAEAMREVMR